MCSVHSLAAEYNIIMGHFAFWFGVDCRDLQALFETEGSSRTTGEGGILVVDDLPFILQSN